MSDLEQTQAIYLEDYDEETDEENTDGEKKIVSFLKVLKQEGFPEKLFPLYEGDNVIGRQEDVCNIAIPLKALSRQHACIEIRGENHLIYDKGSRNKTRKGKLFLTPQVRYELKDKENLLFGDVKCVYIIGEHDNPEDSETGSESGFQTAPGDPVDNQMTTSRVTTLVYESEEEEYESDGSVDLLQPTQAYIQKQDGNKKSRINFDLDTDEDESDRKSPDITVKETPAPRKTKGILSTAVVLPESGSETEEEKSPHSGKGGQMRTVSDMSLLQAPTQRFFAESDAETTEEDSPKKSILCAETQSFLEEKRGKGSGLQGVVLDNDNEEKDEDIPVVEVEEEEENEEEETDMSHLFANPTLASDLPDDVKDTEEDEDTVTKEGDQETETQVFTDQTVAVGDQTVAISDQTVAVSDETVAVSDETVAISEETLVKNKGRAKGGKKYGRNAKCAPVVEVEVNEDDATQKISEITDAATLAVCDQVECEATQVFDSKMKEAETVAIECEATQVLNEKSAEAETVVLECEATQVFDAKTPEAETVVLECEIGDEKITEAETVAVECEATQVFDDNKAAEAETVAMDEATQVFNDKLSEDEKGDSDSTQVLDEKISDAETVSGECEATQVFDNEECNIVKERGNSTAETVALECDPTQVFDEGTDSGPSKSTTVRSDRNTEAETDDHSEITQGIEEVQVVRKRGRGRGKKSAAESEPKSEVTVDSEEIQPKRSGRISKRKSLIVEDKPVEKALDTTTRKGRGRRGKGSKNMADVTEESGGKGEEVTKEETVSDFTTEKTTTEVEEVDSRVDDTKSDTSVDGIAQTVPYTMVCDEEDLQPTQAYCMEEGDEGSTTPPISELLGVEVEDSTPVEPVKIIQEKPDVLPVPIPPSSPHKSALASPGRRSPSPKKVHFEKRESEVLLNEATGSKLKPAEEFPESRSTGRNRRSLPNLTKAAIPTQGKIKKLSLDPPSEAEIPSSAKGRGGTKTNKSGSKETQGVKDKQVKVIDVEETPPLEEMESESVITQKGDEKLNVEEESSQGSSGGRRGKRKSQQVKTESHSEEPTSSQSGEKMQNEGVERDMAKGKKGKRGSKSQEPVSQNSEQPEGSISQGRGRRKRRTVDNEVDQSLSDVKAVKSEGGKQESSDTADRAKNKEPTDSETHLSRGKKVEDHDIEERKTEESPVVKEMNKKTKGCKSSTKAETESVPTKRKGRGTKSDIHVSATSVSSEVEDVLEQPSGESIDKEMEMDNSETISKPGSRRSRKKEALSIISEETSNDSQELPSTSSHNTRTKKGASNTSEKGSKEIIDSVMSESKTKTKQKGRGKEKLEQDKDMVDESEVSDGDSDKKSKRKSVTKQVHDVKTEESQESFISAEPTRGRRRKAVTKQTDSQVTQDDSGSKRKSRGGGHSLTEKGGGESGSRDSSVSGQSEADNVKSSAKKGSNKKVKNDQDTPPGTSDTEMSSDSQDSNKPKGAPKRGRGRHSTAEAKNEVSLKKSKMEPPSTPQQGKKSAKTTDSPSAALRRKSVDPMKPKVMFTGVTDEQGQKVVKDLGGHLVDAVQECTHLVTDKVRRTVKFLCCLARGVPIVNPLWLDSCKSSGMFVDHVPFLIRDEAAERQYKFTLHLSLEKASEASLLSGYQIHVTKSVKPDPANMKDIITCSGAEYLTTLPKKAGEKVVIISCPEDKGMCEAAVKAGVTIVNAEFILTGILRQEIAIESYILFQDKKRSRDSSIGGPPSKKRR